MAIQVQPPKQTPPAVVALSSVGQTPRHQSLTLRQQSMVHHDYSLACKMMTLIEIMHMTQMMHTPGDKAEMRDNMVSSSLGDCLVASICF